MGLFKKFEISNNDLKLTEQLFWDFKAERENSIKEYIFESVNDISNKIPQLQKLVEYDEDCTLTKDNNIAIIESGYNDFSLSFEFNKCSESTRKLTSEELIEIIENMESHFLDNYTLINKLNSQVTELKKFVENQIKRKQTILESENVTIEQEKKARIELNILNQIISKLIS